MNIYIYIYVCVCVYVCMSVRMYAFCQGATLLGASAGFSAALGADGGRQRFRMVGALLIPCRVTLGFRV